MKRLFLTAALFSSTVAGATDIDLSVESGGANSIIVTPGSNVNYQVVALLSDNLNEGLGSVLFDVAFDGGSLSKADEPAALPMINFDRPAGMTNPNGFGGTEIGGKLIQAGGAQNTILSSFAPFPNGTVVTGTGKPSGGSVVVLNGALNAPLEVGTYTLELENIDVNVIRQGEIGNPFWAVDQAGEGTITSLSIEVRALFGDVATLSIATPGTQTLSLDAGLANAGRGYWCLGSASGTSPGIYAGPATLPLNFDFYLNFLFSAPNPPVLQNNFANLDGSGQATTLFNLPGHVAPSAVGLVIDHAFILFPTDYASNVVSVQLTP